MVGVIGNRARWPVDGGEEDGGELVIEGVPARLLGRGRRGRRGGADGALRSASGGLSRRRRAAASTARSRTLRRLGLGFAAGGEKGGGERAVGHGGASYPPRGPGRERVRRGRGREARSLQPWRRYRAKTMAFLQVTPWLHFPFLFSLFN